MKIKFDFSPNYSKKVRSKNAIKYVIIHYTGMQSAIASIKRLKNPRSKVSTHYLINRNGKIIQMVKEENIAWHAGQSKWKNLKNLNKYSIGIELVNKGHKHGYQKFHNDQIKNLIKLCLNLKKKYSIKKENFLGHSDIAPLRKSDPGEKFPWKKLSKYNLGKWYKKKKSIKNRFEINKYIFFKNLKKLGYRYFSLNIRKKVEDKKIIKSFQQHYLPSNVTGTLDQKTHIISHFLTN